MNFKVGDTVRIRSDLQLGKSYGCFGVTREMTALAGKTVKVLRANGGGYVLEGYSQPWFTDGMLESVSTERRENMSRVNQAALANLKEYLLTYREKTLLKIYKGLCNQFSISGGLISSQPSYVADKICAIFASQIERGSFGYYSTATAITKVFDDHNLRREYANNFISEVEKLTKNTAATVTKTIYDEKGENTMNTNKIFNQFMPEVAKGGVFALTMSGKLAVRRSDGDFVVYNEATGTIENQLDLVFGAEQLSGMVYLMPTAADKLKKNDIVKFSDSIYGVVVTDTTDGKVRFINLNSGGAGDRIKETNVLTGAKLYKKVVSMLDLTGANGGAAINPAMFMLMGNKSGGNNDMLTMLALSGGLGGAATTGGFNPAMLMLMDNKGGGSNDMFKMLAMTSLMGGGANPFANLFGGAATAATTVAAD